MNRVPPTLMPIPFRRGLPAHYTAPEPKIIKDADHLRLVARLRKQAGLRPKGFVPINLRVNRDLSRHGY